MSPKLQVLCFLIGGRSFAIDIMGIREILRNQRLTPVPRTPVHVAGVLNLRGGLIPVVDVHQLLIGGPNPLPQQEMKLIVVYSRGRTAGLLVDQISDVVNVKPEGLSPVPGGYGLTGNEGPEPVVLATFRRGEERDSEVVVLVRLALLLDGTAQPVPEEART